VIEIVVDIHCCDGVSWMGEIYITSRMSNSISEMFQSVPQLKESTSGNFSR